MLWIPYYHMAKHPWNFAFSEDRSSRKICQKLITQDSFQSWGFLEVMTPNRRLLLELTSGSHNQTNSVCQLKHTVMWMSSRYSSIFWGMRAACRMLSGLSSLWGERCQSSVSFIVDTVIKNAPGWEWQSLHCNSKSFLYPLFPQRIIPVIIPDNYIILVLSISVLECYVVSAS